MNIAILDAATLGGDIDFSLFNTFGGVAVYERTAPDQVAQRIDGCDIVIVNKIKLGEHNLADAKRLKLICVTATGYDNIDVEYCKNSSIAVCNVKGYSTESVTQLTLSMALSLATHIKQFDDYVKSGEYTKSGVQNHLTPVFGEIAGKTWGIAGLGAIGRRVAAAAETLGCRVLAYKRVMCDDYECVPLSELCERSDIISIHLPLSESTRGIIGKEMIAKMKPGAIVINVSRGAVADEAALANAIKEGRIGGLCVDVYSVEPMAADSPYNEILDDPNVILTPHMAWGAYESRVRCMEEIALNIDAFINNRIRNRVEI